MVLKLEKKMNIPIDKGGKAMYERSFFSRRNINEQFNKIYSKGMLLK